MKKIKGFSWKRMKESVFNLFHTISEFRVSTTRQTEWKVNTKSEYQPHAQPHN